VRGYGRIPTCDKWDGLIHIHLARNPDVGNVARCPCDLVPLDLETLTVSLMGRRVMPLMLAPEMVAVGQDEVVLALFRGWPPESTNPSTGPERTPIRGVTTGPRGATLPPTCGPRPQR
jgi:hypothetical protein